MLIGCQADSPSLMYAQEAHAQKVAAWCYAYSGTTASLQEECVRRVWINVPVSDYWIKYHGTIRELR
jgi:hypothetical protein